jgi:putative heme iron utilization protein
MERNEALQQMGELIDEQRWAALATVDAEGRPQASMVAYVPEPGFSGFLLHLSRLAAHTGQLLETPWVSLVIAEGDNLECDPQTLQRVSLSGPIRPIERDSEDYRQARQRYLARLPDSEQLFGFGDFMLLRLQPETLRFVGGFGRAFSFAGSELTAAGTAP